jgi:hypothetical protein
VTNLRPQSLTLATNRLATREPEDWRLDAACRDWNHERDGDPWHPDSSLPNAYTRAREICSPCPVAAACLEVAMAAEGGIVRDSRYGMFGGLSPHERARLRREGKKAAS